MSNDSERLHCEAPYSSCRLYATSKKLYTNYDGGLSRLVLKDRATKIAEKVLPPDLLHGLKASDGFIEKVLRYYNLIGVSLHGEGNEMSEEEADALMRPFRVELGELCEKYNKGC